jgi:hypothetical protein
MRQSQLLSSASRFGGVASDSRPMRRCRRTFVKSVHCLGDPVRSLILAQDHARNVTHPFLPRRCCRDNPGAISRKRLGRDRDTK